VFFDAITSNGSAISRVSPLFHEEPSSREMLNMVWLKSRRKEQKVGLAEEVALRGKSRDYESSRKINTKMGLKWCGLFAIDSQLFQIQESAV
jgi:hypothetical protein